MKAYFKTLTLKHEMFVAIAAIIFVAGITLLAMAGGGILSPENKSNAVGSEASVAVYIFNYTEYTPGAEDYTRYGYSNKGGYGSISYYTVGGVPCPVYDTDRPVGTYGFTYGTSYPVRIGPALKTGFELDSSLSTPAYNSGATVSNPVTLPTSMSFTFYFKYVRYHISFDFKGGQSGNGYYAYVYSYYNYTPFVANNQSITTLSAPTRKGYAFTGFYTQEKGAGDLVFDKDMNIQSKYSQWPLTSDTTLYANWIPTFSGGNGSQSTPYLISTKDDLQVLAELVNSGENTSGVYFKQTKDIDISGSTWTPIGNSSSNYFAGVYDGQGYKIEGLTINTSSSYQGLFGYVIGSSSSAKAEIKNVAIANCYVSGGSYTGGLIGDANSYVDISNCKSNGEIKGSSYTGGVVGYVGSSVNISACQNNADIKGSSYTGGIVGEAPSSAVILNCVNTGSVTASGDYAGGVCGHSNSYITLTSCVNIGNISANGNLGGILGNGYGAISLCISKGNVTSTGSTGNYVGGIIGYANSSSAPLSNCAAEGYIFHSGSSSYVGALIGYASSSSNKVEACSFKGSSNKSLGLYGGTTAPTMTACWAKCGESKVFSSTPDSTWTTYWAVVPNMNDGLPIQKTLYSVASVASSTLDDLKTAFRNHGFSV